MRLVLLRHGQTTSNVGGNLDTAEPGARLTALGHEQARAAADALAGERFDVVVVSTLVRTHETAAPLLAARGVQPRVRAGIREVQAGDLEMRDDEPAVRAFLRVLAAWFHGDLDAAMPGGESGAEALARFDAVVAELADEGVERALLVSHGAVLRLWASHRCTDVDPAEALHRGLSNTGVLVVEGDPASGFRLVSWEGEAVGGEAVRDDAHDGVAGDGA